MGRYGSLDYATLAKRGFLLGLTLFLTGAAGGIVGPAVFGPLPAVGMQLLFDAELLGLLVGFFSPLVFGVLLPLTE